MLNLFDMLASAQNGQGIEMLARQFNLSQQQAQLAVEALLPAFSQGLKRNTADPYGLGSFMTAMASGQHAKYFEDASKAFAPQGVDEGNGILGHLFGSKELSRAVASQAAQATGIGTAGAAADAAGHRVDGDGRPVQAVDRSDAGRRRLRRRQQSARRDHRADDAARRMAGGQPQPRQAPQQPANPFDNPFGKVLQDMFGGGAPSSSSHNRASRRPKSLWRQSARQDFRRDARRRARPRPAGARAGAAAARQSVRPPAAIPMTICSARCSRPAAKQRDEYQKGVESIFDQFTKGMDRYR